MQTSDTEGVKADTPHPIFSHSTDSAQAAIQQILYEAFNDARSRNPHVSLRAFARRLAVSPAALSEILRGKRRISMNRAKELIERMGLDPQESDRILDLFASESRNHVKKTNVNNSDLKALQTVTDQYNIASEWYHYAIVALAQSAGFEGRVEQIAKRLAISEKIAQQALDRLIRVDILLTEGGKIILKEGLKKVDGAIPQGIINSALRKAQTQNLDLARVALDHEDIQNHEFDSLTIAMSPDQLPEARQIIKEFFQKFEASLDLKTNRTEVFKLNLQLIQLSKKEKRGALGASFSGGATQALTDDDMDEPEMGKRPLDN
jgi:uncharacterized protein (TIGR02147 family)